MIIKEIETLLTISLEDALKRKHEYILLEHLLLQILNLEGGKNIFLSLGKNINPLKKKLDEYLDDKIEIISRNHNEPLTSIMVERVINRAIQNSIETNKKSCDISDILLSILEEKDSYAVLLLNEIDFNKEFLVNLKEEKKVLGKDNLTHSSRLINFANHPFLDLETLGKSKEKVFTSQVEKDNPFPEILINVLEKSKNNFFDNLIGRENELEKIYLVLARRKKNNPLLIGEAGVGKTSLVQGIANHLKENIVPHFLQGSMIYSLEYSYLLAGTKYRGELETRLGKIFSFLKEFSQIILLIDDIHFLFNSNTSNSNQNDSINLLKIFLTNQRTKCIAISTYQEYHNHQNKEISFFRQFEKIEIKEPSLDEAEKILLSLKKKYETFHHVKYTPQAIRKIVEITKQYLPEKKLPDGAIDLLDYCGAKEKLKRKLFKRDSQFVKKTIDQKKIEENVTQLKGFPIKKINSQPKSFYLKLEKTLKSKIFGQNHAIEEVLKTLKLAQTGLIEKDKLLGSFLFTGPTGVGKTELCKNLAQHMHLNLIRLDMSEYMEAHSVAKLIGAPPGYIGYNEKNNELSEKMKKDPYSLILLDEIEKAHPDVVNIFLQVMDYGMMTDSQGNKINFKNSLLIMTSNLGANDFLANPLGFIEKSDQIHEKIAVNNFFTPEFRNRLNMIVRFNFINSKMARLVVLKFIDELNLMLKEKKVKVEVDKLIIDFLIERGIDKKMGARPLKKIIEKEIKEKIVDELLSRHFKNHSIFKFKIEKDQLKYSLIES